MLLFLENISTQMILFSSSITFPNNTSCYQSTFSANISQFFEKQEKFKKNLLITSQKIREEIISPLTYYCDSLSSDYDKMLQAIQNLLFTLSSHQETLINARNLYYNECKKTQVMETESLKQINESNNTNDSMKIEEIHKKLVEQKKIMEIKGFLYQKEINIINKLYAEFENEYNEIMKQITNTEESRLLFMKTIIEKYLTLIDNFTGVTSEQNKNLITIFSGYNPFIDLTSFNDNFNNYNSCNKGNLIKWEKIKFETFDTFKLNQEREEKRKLIDINAYDHEERELQNQYPNMFNNESSSSISQSNLSSNEKIHFDIISKPPVEENIVEKEIKEILSKFVDSLFKEESLFPDILTSVIDLIDSNNNVMFYKMLLEIYIKHRQSHHFYKYLNFSNLTHFTNLIKNIVSNLDFTKEFKKYSLDIISTLLTIGEKSFYESTYMCALLSQNNLFKDRKMWSELIEYQIIVLLNLECLKLKKINDKDKSLKNQMIFKSFANLLYKASSPNLILEKTKVSQEIKNYKELTPEQKELLNTSITKNVLHSVIKEYIIHMSNYNYEMGSCHDIIMDICSKYKIQNQSINFYIIYLNTSFYTVRKNLPNLASHHKNIRDSNYLKKVDGITNHQKTNTFILKFPCQMVSNNEKIIILNNVFKYLSDRDKLNIMYLNKEISSKLIRKIHMYMLNLTKNNIGKHVKIWKSILKCNSLKKKYSYKEILTQIDIEEDPKKNNIIDLDVKRTTFKNDIEKGRLAITKILKGFVYVENKIKYCQGMNYIAAFLYQITGYQEEESFYLMLGLIKNSLFGVIFTEDDMIKLKTFFYVLRRLIFLYMPELISFFNVNGVNIRYFASPWFITLFTIFYQNLEEINSKVLVQIWDDFLIHGWKSIFSSMLAVIKYNYGILLTLRGDELLTFMINDLAKSSIFKNENYEIFSKLKEEYKLKTTIVKNLEEEIELEAGIDKINMSLLIDKSFEEN